MGVTSKRRRSLALVARAAVSILLLALVLRIVDVDSILEVLSRVDWWFAILGALIFMSTFALFAERLHILIGMTGHETSFRDVLQVNLVGAFFSLLLPTAIGGDVVRAYKLSRDEGLSTHGVSAVVIDRIIGLLTLLVYALAGLLLGSKVFPESQLVVVASIALVTLLTVLIVLLRGKRNRLEPIPSNGRRVRSLMFHLRTIQASFQVLGRDPIRMSAAVGMSLLGQAFNMVSVIVLARSIGIVLPWVIFLAVVPVVWLVTVLPFTISGVGAREGAFVVLLGGVGVDSAQAVALGLLVYSCYLMIGIIGGFASLKRSIKGDDSTTIH